MRGLFGRYWLSGGFGGEGQVEQFPDRAARAPDKQSTVMYHMISLFFLGLVSSICVSLLFYHALTGVPSWPLGRAEAADVTALLRAGTLPNRPVIYELGCGWGSLLIQLSNDFPDAAIKGIEVSPFPYLVSRLRTAHLPNVAVRRANFYDCELADADAVTCYLMTKAMPSSRNS
jgi:cyclopropane fatty-acyl-phospholipid synthase-like methyltransferase